jgi:nicotinate-nucleotide pyrophosphorylase (carboxylating)
MIDLDPLIVDSAVRAALSEDIGRGDVTTLSTIPEQQVCSARVLAKSPGVICGLALAAAAFRILDANVQFERRCDDGYVVDQTPCEIAIVTGNARAILTAERTALNFLQHLSGIATSARRFSQLVDGTSARVVDTRKTLPGMRALQKYAVRTGGAGNHRFGLDDGVLIKDNHIAAAGGIREAVSRARYGASHMLKVEVEAEDLAQVDEAIAAGADIVMLDNMSLEEMRVAVARIAGRAITEASGGIREDTIRAIAETGVDLVSVGTITHSVQAMDISLDFDQRK